MTYSLSNYMPLLAESLPDPTSFAAIGWVCVITACVFSGVNQALRFFDRFKQKAPNPPLHKEFASKEEHDGLRDEFKDFRDEVRVSFDEAAETSRASREKIYVEQRRQSELLAGNSAKAELTHQRVETLDQKMDRLLERATQRK